MPDKIDVDKILAEIGDTDLGKQMLEILKITGMPKISTDKSLGEGTLGEYDTIKNTIDLSWRLDPGFSARSATKQPGKIVSTLAHELQHATNNAIGNELYTKGSTFPKSVKAEIDKFSTSKGEVAMESLISKADDSSYRRDWSERNAFGAGNHVGYQLGAPPSRPVAHADATSAQENAIKMDLFLRGLQRKSK